MSKFRITSKAGVEFGVYEGETREAAFAAMVADAGDGADDDGNRTAGSAADWIIEEVEQWEAWEDGRRDEAVQYWVPCLGGDPVATGADMLGVEVTDALNVERVL